jgi:hypothetical protein
MIAAPPPVYPWPIGAGERYHPRAANQAVLDGRPIGRLRCSGGRRFAVHVELFANRRVAILPPRIGVSRRGCGYQLRTTTPTGVVEVLRRGSWTLGDLFRVWGRRLSPHALLTFDGRVAVYVGGRRHLGDPRNVVLTRHAEIVVEVGGYVAPHRMFLFPKGGP